MATDAFQYIDSATLLGSSLLLLSQYGSQFAGIRRTITQNVFSNSNEKVVGTIPLIQAGSNDFSYTPDEANAVYDQMTRLLVEVQNRKTANELGCNLQITGNTYEFTPYDTHQVRTDLNVLPFALYSGIIGTASGRIVAGPPHYIKIIKDPSRILMEILVRDSNENECNITVAATTSVVTAVATLAGIPQYVAFAQLNLVSFYMDKYFDFAKLAGGMVLLPQNDVVLIARPEPLIPLLKAGALMNPYIRFVEDGLLLTYECIDSDKPTNLSVVCTTTKLDASGQSPGFPGQAKTVRTIEIQTKGRIGRMDAVEFDPIIPWRIKFVFMDDTVLTFSKLTSTWLYKDQTFTYGAFLQISRNIEASEPYDVADSDSKLRNRFLQVVSPFGNATADTSALVGQRANRSKVNSLFLVPTTQENPVWYSNMQIVAFCLVLLLLLGLAAGVWERTASVRALLVGRSGHSMRILCLLVPAALFLCIFAVSIFAKDSATAVQVMSALTIACALALILACCVGLTMTGRLVSAYVPIKLLFAIFLLVGVIAVQTVLYNSIGTADMNLYGPHLFIGAFVVAILAFVIRTTLLELYFIGMTSETEVSDTKFARGKHILLLGTWAIVFVCALLGGFYLMSETTKCRGEQEMVDQMNKPDTSNADQNNWFTKANEAYAPNDSTCPNLQSGTVANFVVPLLLVFSLLSITGAYQVSSSLGIKDPHDTYKVRTVRYFDAEGRSITSQVLSVLFIGFLALFAAASMYWLAVDWTLIRGNISQCNGIQTALQEIPTNTSRQQGISNVYQDSLVANTCVLSPGYTASLFVLAGIIGMGVLLTLPRNAAKRLGVTKFAYALLFIFLAFLAYFVPLIFPNASWIMNQGV